MGIIHKPKKYHYKSKYKHQTIYDDLKNSSNPFLADKTSLSYKDREKSSNKPHKPKKKNKKLIPVKKHKIKTSSKGETRIESYLKTKLIWFEREKEMLGMTNIKGNANLRFDFFLPMHNIAIEFDGAQHFKESKFDTKRNTLENRQQNDLCKNNFCKSKNIKLVRIHYTDFSLIETILKREIHSLI